MPFCARLVGKGNEDVKRDGCKMDCNGNLSKSYDLQGEDSTRQDREQKVLLDLISCIVSLSSHAYSIHSELQKDFLKVSDRMQNLNGRLEILKESSSRLPLCAAQIDVKQSSLSRYTSANSHNHSYEPLDQDVLTPRSRPAYLTTVYDLIGKQIPHPVTHTSTQTEPPVLANKRLTTGLDEEKEKLNEVESEVVAVDVSGAQLRRMAAARRRSHFIPSNIQPVKNRRNTIEIHAEDGVVKNKHPLKIETRSRQDQEDIYDDLRAMTECPYELLPFQNRKQRRSKSWFSSLRKSRKHKSTDFPTVKHLDLVQNTPPPAESTNENGDLHGLRRSVRRCMSLRLGSSSRRLVNKFRLSGTNPSVIYDDLPYNGNPTVPPSQLTSPSKDTLKKKLNLPISTQSQVIHLASLMRNCNDTVNGTVHSTVHDEDQRLSASSGYGSCKDVKVRPNSIISVGSINSLQRTLQVSSGTYRVGYQLDFPAECSADANELESHEHTPSPMSNGRASLSSCDPDGYFTSMRRHSGILSANEHSPIPNNSSPISITDNSEPIVEVSESLTRIECYPPLVEVTLSDCSESLSPRVPCVKIHKPKVIPHRNIPIVTAKFVSATNNNEEKVDVMLMKKFEAEILNKRVNLNCEINKNNTCSLPRSANIPSGFAPHIFTSSLPRKSVRFFD